MRLRGNRKEEPEKIMVSWTLREKGVSWLIRPNAVKASYDENRTQL